MLDQVADMLAFSFYFRVCVQLLAYCLLLVCSTKLYAEICLHLLIIVVICKLFRLPPFNF